MKKGSRGKSKRYPYIDVAGVDSDMLDRFLLEGFENKEILCKNLLDTSLPRKAKISSLEIRKLSIEEIISRTAPFLKDDYSFYNFLVNQCANQLPILAKKILGFCEGIDDAKLIATNLYKKNIPVFLVINFLRFYQSPKYHDIIKPFLELVNTVDENVLDVEEALGNDKDRNISKEVTDFDKINNRVNDQSQKSIQGAFDQIIGSLQELQNRVHIENFEPQYQEASAKNEKLQMEIAKLKKSAKSKDQIMEKQKTLINRQTKENESLHRQITELNKTIGKLGTSLGELRKDTAQLTTEKEAMQKKAQDVEKDLSQARSELFSIQNQNLMLMEKNQELTEKLKQVEEKHQERMIILKQKIKGFKEESLDLKQKVKILKEEREKYGKIIIALEERITKETGTSVPFSGDQDFKSKSELEVLEDFWSGVIDFPPEKH